jgi:antibiotic biosynthesis monooxygenase (ABM) superfamily enzyme
MPANASAAPAPSVHRRALITWFAVYPVITLVLGLLGPRIATLPLLLRTLILTGIVVPVAAYVLVPALTKAHARLSAHGHRP